MSGSAKAGTIAERHTCELRVLIGRNRARSSEARLRRNLFLLDKDLHGCRQTVLYKVREELPVIREQRESRIARITSAMPTTRPECLHDWRKYAGRVEKYQMACDEHDVSEADCVC